MKKEMQTFPGLRVLVVEDEPLISMELQDLLVDMQCEVVGVASDVESALALAQSCDFDLAILDVNLGGQRIDPVAQLIAKSGRRIIFATGYSKETAPQVSAELLEKPHQLATLRRALCNVTA